MDFYLVGGAVRDKLLGYPIRERDWVVVGGTPELLKQQGYRQVGRDFPVFLHPASGEEYALARTERKSAPGYYGFLCRFDPKVTLEEDLLRRDLTINAMAMDNQGNLIDPYQGQSDLEAKLLRHVSPAFTEDPLRILRVARFATRYYHLGFRIAEETRQLMYAMVKQRELSYLVAERVWQEWQRSLIERNPEIFIKTLRACGALKEVLPELDVLFGVPNSHQHHLEVDTGEHTLLALAASAKLSTDPTIRFAAMVHDLGKAATPINKWPKHHGHDEKGIAIIKSLCDRLRIPTEYRRLATKVSQLHLLIHRLFELRAATIVKTFEKADAFRQPQQFAKLLMVCEADAQAKGKHDDYPQAEKWRDLLAECAKISPRLFVEQALQGEAIKKALFDARVTCVDRLLQTWKRHEK